MKTPANMTRWQFIGIALEAIASYPKGPSKFNLQRVPLTTAALRTVPIRINQGN
jgi:hypothetical protein